jgi:hypothetical protein
MIGEPFNTAEFGEVPSDDIPLRLRYRVAASETEEGKKHEQSYYEALGRFVQMFAEVEKVVTETLWAYSKTQTAVSKIIFAQTSIDQAAKFIKGLAAATGADEEKRIDLDDILRQFNVIKKARNGILHYGASLIAEGRATVSNAWKAKAEPTEFPVSPRSLSEMRDDLRKIIAHLGYRHLGRPRPRGTVGINTLEEILQRSWRYNHPS